MDENSDISKAVAATLARMKNQKSTIEQMAEGEASDGG